MIVFLDSDVIPEEGWLAGLLRAFRNPAVQVVCGGTYISLEGLYSKTVALFWFFPLREEGDGLCQTDSSLRTTSPFGARCLNQIPFHAYHNIVGNVSRWRVNSRSEAFPFSGNKAHECHILRRMG